MKLTLTVVLVLIAYLLISIRFPYVSSQDKGTKCADCRQYDAEKSPHTTHGFYCKSKEDHKKFVSKGKNPYPVCIPQGLGFHSSHHQNPEIFDYCCFWGPDLPCGQLVGKEQQEKWEGKFPITCHMCKDHCFPHPKVQHCADCGEFNKKHYKHKKHHPKSTGFHCLKSSDGKKVHKGHRKKEFSFKNTCVPTEYAIDGEIFDMCCFWTPEMGCGQLVGVHKKNSCDLCKGHCPKSSRSSDANGFELSSILLFLSIVQCVLIWKI